MKQNELNEKNILNEEQQKEFNRLMDEYEERNDSLSKSYNDEGMIGNVIHNKTFMFGALAVCAAICLAGLFFSFEKISVEENANMEKMTETQQAMAVDQQNINNQQQQEQISPDEQLEKQEEEKELEEIKSGFKPFDDDNQSTITSDENNVITDQNNFNSGSYVYNNGVEQNTLPSEVTPLADQQQSGVASPAMESEQAPAPVYELKGIAEGANGKLAYISNGTATGTYRVGDAVGNFTLQSIDSTTVTLVEKGTGYPLYLNK